MMFIYVPDFGSKLRGLEAEVQASVKPFGDLLDRIGNLCNELALDVSELDSGTFNDYAIGKSDLAHTILRMIAKTIHDVEEA